MFAQVIDLIGGEPERGKIVERLFKPGYDKIRAVPGQLADEQLEDSSIAEAVLKISGRHREFVEVGREP